MYKRLIAKYKGKKIFRSMFAAVFGLAAVCILMACVLGFFWFRATQIEEEKQNDSNMLYASSLMVDNAIHSVRDTMEVLRNDAYVKKALLKTTDFWNDDISVAAQEIINSVTADPMFHSIYVLKDGDYLLKCTNPSYPLNKQADDMMIETFYQSSFGEYATKYYIDIYGVSQSLLYMTAGEQALATGEKENGIMISIDIGKVMGSILPKTQEEGEQYLLADGAGNVVYARGGRYGNGEKLQEEILLKFMQSEEIQQSEIIQLENGKYLASCVRTGDEFYLMHLIPYRYIAQTINHVRMMFLSIGILLFVLILLLAFGMSNWVYSPIEAVVKTTNAQGQPPENISERLEKTELASIAQTYHTMVQTLNNLNMQKEQDELAHYLSSKLPQNKLPEWVEENYGKEGLRCRVLCLRISDTKDFHENNTEEAIAFEIQTISNIIAQVLKPMGEILVNPIDKEYIAVVLFARKSYTDEELTAKIGEIFTVTRELIHIGMDAGISNEKEGLKELAPMYQMARAATAYRFMYGVNAIVTEDQMTEKALSVKSNVNTDNLIRLLKDCDRDGFTEEYFKIIEELKEFSIQTAREALVGMAAEMQKYYNSLNYHYAPLSGADYENLSNELAKFEYIDDAREWFFHMVDEIWVVLIRAKQNGREDVVDKALSYLNDHYADPNISAQYIADLYHITPSYFSRLFNERSGQAFPDYLATLRIEKAAEILLTDQNRSIQEICEKVGYTNSSYFTATFKKKYGITPGQFRKNHRESNEKQH